MRQIKQITREDTEKGLRVFHEIVQLLVDQKSRLSELEINDFIKTLIFNVAASHAAINIIATDQNEGLAFIHAMRLIAFEIDPDSQIQIYTEDAIGNTVETITTNTVSLSNLPPDELVGIPDCIAGIITDHVLSCNIDIDSCSDLEIKLLTKNAVLVFCSARMINPSQSSQFTEMIEQVIALLNVNQSSQES